MLRPRMRVLVLSQRLPYAPNSGDRLRVFHMVREIASHADVDIASLVHDEEEASHVDDLKDIAQHVIAARIPRFATRLAAGVKIVTPTPLTHVLLDSPQLQPALASHVSRFRPNVVLVFCSSMAKFVLTPPLAGIPYVLDMIDADSAKWETLADRSRFPLRWIYRREARLLEQFEVVAMGASYRTLVVNERERAALRALDPRAPVDVLENGVDLTAFQASPQSATSESVVFCGVMSYAPNAQGAVWLSREVWPLVRQRHPGAQLTIVGASPSSEVRALHDPDSGITVTGAVPDVRPYLRAAATAVAPLHIARGVQNKVLEAVASGLPCVITPTVAAGLPRSVMPACPVGETPAEFADEISRLLRLSPERRRDIAASADLSELSWSGRLRALVPLLEAAAATEVGAWT